jgi:hypothetical protein
MAELEEHPDPVEVGGDRGKGMLSAASRSRVTCQWYRLLPAGG